MINSVFSLALSAALLLSQPQIKAESSSAQVSQGSVAQKEVLASESFDLDNRYPAKSVSEGFKENILIALGYLAAESKDIQQREEGDFVFSLILEPGEVFAFHSQILPEFKNTKIITQKSGFLPKDGYKTIAGLAGNGVCHLATLMNWVASEAGLEVTAPTNHDFAAIPGIDRKYGTSIYFTEAGGSVTERQNLYLKNNKDYSVSFVFSLKGDNLIFSINRI